MKWFFRLVYKFRFVVVVVTIFVSLFFGYWALKIKINPNVTSYLPKSDPSVKVFNEIGENFGGNYLAIVALKTDDIFNIKTLQRISLLTSQIKQIEGVSDVISLTNIIDIKKADTGIEVGKLLDEFNLPKSDSEIQQLKYYVLSKDIYQGHIISEDGKTTLLIVRLQSDVNQIKVVKEIKQIVEKSKGTEKIFYAGVPFQMLEINQIIRSDLRMLIPFVAFLIGLILFLSFRNVVGVILPLVTVLISILTTLGIMSILRIPITIISNIIPVIIFTVGSAYSVHIINRFYQETTTNEALPSAFLNDVSISVILAGITTIAGFISFVFGSYLIMVKEFGIFSSLGIFVSLLVSLTFVPACLFIFASQQKIKDKFNRKDFLRFAIVNKLGTAMLKTHRVVLIVTSIIAIISLWAIPKIPRSADMIEYFKPNSQIRIAEQMMNKNFGGSVPIQILVKGDIQDPAVLNKIRELQTFLSAHPDIHYPQSIVDLITEMSFVIGEGRIIPDNKAKVSNLWFLLEGEEMVNQMVDSDKSSAVVQAMVSGIETKQSKQMLKDIKNYLDNNSSDDCTMFLTGSPIIYDHLEQSLSRSQIQSLIIAVVLVFICLVIMMRAFWISAVGLIPIVFTLVVIFGFMGYAKIPLDVATVLVGSVSIGVGIDYAIHFLNRYQQEIKQNKNNQRKALLDTLQTSGQAILINVLTVSIGFLVLVFANLIPLQRFGILLAITMIFSGISALIVLPAIIVKISAKKQEEK
ncbi:MAG: MMPL family transporter [candidate division WOR-3 bacterium]